MTFSVNFTQPCFGLAWGGNLLTPSGLFALTCDWLQWRGSSMLRYSVNTNEALRRAVFASRHEYLKPMTVLDDANLRQQPLSEYPWLRQLPGERLLDLHRRNLRSQRLKTKHKETRPQPLSEGSPPHLPTQKRAYDIDSSHRNCEQNAAVEPVPATAFSRPRSDFVFWLHTRRTGHCGNNFVKI